MHMWGNTFMLGHKVIQRNDREGELVIIQGMERIAVILPRNVGHQSFPLGLRQGASALVYPLLRWQGGHRRAPARKNKLEEASDGGPFACVPLWALFVRDVS